MTIFNEKNSWLFTVGIGLKFEVLFRIGFLANFHNILELKCNKNCFTDSEKCETTKYIKLNKGK
jgi:hypothetical protein